MAPHSDTLYPLQVPYGGTAVWRDTTKKPLPTGNAPKPLALSFDGIDGWINTGNKIDLANTHFTIEFWAKRDIVTNTQQTIISQGQATDNRGLQIGFGSNHHFFFSFTGNDIETDTAIIDKEWHHYACVYNSKNKEQILYFDGIEVKKRTATAHFKGSGNFQIGKGLGDEFFSGFLNEIRVWDWVRTAEEIKSCRPIRLIGNEAGLNAYWRLDEVTETTVKDATGQNNDGTITGGAVWKNIPVVIANPYLVPDSEIALALDGEDDFIDLGNPKALQITGDQTIEMWLCPTVFGARRNPYAKAYGGEGSITLEADGRLAYYYGTSGADAPPYRAIITREALPLKQWSHIAIVRSITEQKMRWYINGEIAKDVSYEGGATYPAAKVSNNKAFLGQGYAEKYCGHMDEVRIWNRARTQAEIQENKDKRLKGQEKGLVGYWRLHELSGTVAKDASTVRNHGTIAGDASWRPLMPPPLIEGVLRFGGNNRLLVPYNPKLKITTYTVELWLFPCKPIQSWSGILGKPGRNYHIWLNGYGYIHHRFRTNRSTNFGGDTPRYSVKWGRWQHIAITNDGEQFMTYIDGKNLLTESVNGTLIPNETDLYIGCNLDNGAANRNAFLGCLQEIRIWDHARTQAEIVQNKDWRLTGKEEGLVGYWPLIDGTNSSTKDFTDNGNDGTLSGTQWNWGLPLSGLSFDGNRDLVAIGDANLAKTLVSKTFTVEAWVNFIHFHSWGGIISAFQNNGSFQKGWVLGNRSTRFMFSVSSAGADDGNGKFTHVTSRYTYQKKNWYHIAGVYDGQKMILYVNGEEQGTSTEQSGDINYPDDAEFVIGAYKDSNEFNSTRGNIQEVRLWNYARSPTQIRAFQEKPLEGNETGLVGYWPLTDGSGTVADDKTAQENHGTLVGATW